MCRTRDCSASQCATRGGPWPRNKVRHARFVRLVADILVIVFSSAVQGVVSWSKERVHGCLVRALVRCDLVSALRDCHLILGQVMIKPICLSSVQPLSIVDHPSFRDLLKELQPDMRESDIPHRTTITRMVLNTADEAQQNIKERYKVHSSHLFGWHGWMGTIFTLL
jgi:hypothetical protein